MPLQGGLRGEDMCTVMGEIDVGVCTMMGGLVVQGGVKGWSKIGLRRAEAVVRGYSVKEGILQSSWRDACVRASFLVGLRASGLRLCWGGDSGTGVFCEFCKVF